jgi:hypothetical protein
MNLPKLTNFKAIFSAKSITAAIVVVIVVAGFGYILATHTGSSPTVPTVSISTDPATVPSGSRTTVNWSSINATSCMASGAWSGAKTTSGSMSTGVLTSTKIYMLSCTGNGGNGTGSTDVIVAPVSPTPSGGD